jgi:hypothetical protein
MKVFAIILFACMGSVSVFAQQDTTSSTPIQGLPSGQQQAGEQKEDRVEVDKAKLPPTMLKELNNGDQYKGWEDANIYYEKNSDQYLLNIAKENTTQTFRFDKDGNPIVTDQPVEAGDRNR